MQKLLLPIILAMLSLPIFATEVVCIDPGHPSEIGDGTRGKKVTEMHVAWVVGLELKKLLVVDGIKVVMTKTKEKEFVANKKRAEIANKAKADLMLRLHLDASTETGFSSYYPDRQGTNQGKKGPSKDIIAKSKKAVNPFHEAVMEILKGHLNDRGVRTEQQTAVGKKNGALIGSIFSEVPVILVEMAVLTQPKDEAFIGNKKGQLIMAKALFAGTKAALQALQK